MNDISISIYIKEYIYIIKVITNRVVEGVVHSEEEARCGKSSYLQN